MAAGRYPAELLDQRGCFPGIFPLLRRLRRSDCPFRAAIMDELSGQVQFMLDHGLRPTHLNGHQYIELLPAVSAIVPAMLEKFGIGLVRVAAEPSLGSLIFGRGLGIKGTVLAAGQQLCAGRFRRRLTRLGIPYPDAYYGTGLAGRIHLARMRAFLRRRYGLAEICLHPAEATTEDAEKPAEGWNDPLATLRPRELEMLVSAELAAELTAREVKLGRLSEAMHCHTLAPHGNSQPSCAIR